MRQFEYWSQLCLRVFFSNFLSIEPSYLVHRKKNFSKLNLLCILGPVASGKTEAASVFIKDFGFKEVNSGRTLAELLKLR